MQKEFDRRAQSDNPVRFVLTTGDNIYEDRFLGLVTIRDGRRDRDWGAKVFEPYVSIRRSIPFYPSPGNHDVPAMQPEPTGEPGAYFDNFFLSSEPYYTFSYGGLADFFAIDTTAIQEPQAVTPIDAGSTQFRWLQQALADSRAPWKIAYFHHPPFNAGPGHPADMDGLRHLVQLFRQAEVNVAFNGHEHNFQFSKRNDATGGVLYVVSGAGGQLRGGNIRSSMESENMAGAASQHHFLVVEIDNGTMRITPVSWEPVRVEDAGGNAVAMPILVELPGESGAVCQCPETGRHAVAASGMPSGGGTATQR
jgi:hypothetical protein